MSPKNLRGQLALVPCMSCGEGATAHAPLVVQHEKGQASPPCGGAGGEQESGTVCLGLSIEAGPAAEGRLPCCLIQMCSPESHLLPAVPEPH